MKRFIKRALCAAVCCVLLAGQCWPGQLAWAEELPADSQAASSAAAAGDPAQTPQPAEEAPAEEEVPAQDELPSSESQGADQPAEQPPQQTEPAPQDQPAAQPAAASTGGINWAPSTGWTDAGDSFSKADPGLVKRVSADTFDTFDITGTLSFSENAASGAGLAVYANADHTPHSDGFTVNWDFPANQISVISGGAYVVAPIGVPIQQGQPFSFRILAENGRLQVWHGNLEGDPVIDTEIGQQPAGHLAAYAAGGGCTFTLQPPADPTIQWADSTGWTEGEDSFTKADPNLVKRVSVDTYDSFDVTGSLTFLENAASGAGLAVYANADHTPHSDGFTINWDFPVTQVSVISGGSYVAAPVSVPIEAGQPFSFRILAENGRIQVWHGDLSGEPVIDVEIGQQSAGHLAAYAAGGSCTFSGLRMNGGSVPQPASAELKQVYIDGQPLGNFKAGTTDYTIPYPQDGQPGQISAEAKDAAATVDVTQPTADQPGTVTVTATDGAQKTYTFTFAPASTNMSGWNALKQGWHMEGTSLVGDGEGSDDTHAYDLLTLMTTNEMEDLTISGDIMLGAPEAGTGDDASQGGFVIRSGEPNQYGYENSYVVMMHYNPNYGGTGKVYNEVAIWRFDNNVNADVIAHTTDVSLSLGEVYQMKVTANGSKIRVYINGEMVLEVEDSLHTAGSVGLFRNGINAGKQVTFSNIQLSESESDNALLDSILVDGQPLAGFTPYTYNYTYTLTGDTWPEVSAQAQDAGAKVDITQATAEQPTAVIRVTAADGISGKVYRVAMRDPEAAGQLGLQLPETAWADSTLEVTVTAKDVTTLTGGDVTLAFDSEMLEFVSVVPDENLLPAEDSAVLDYTLSAGQVRVVFSKVGANALTQDSALFTVTFRPLGQGETTLALRAGSEISTVFGDITALEQDITATLTIQGETPPETADKSALQALADKAAGLVESDYTAASWTVFRQAYEQALRLLADETATQQQVDQAAQALQSAMDSLEKAPQNYAVRILASANGTVTANKETAAPGELVTLTVQPAAGYQLKALFLNGTRIAASSFHMPQSDAEVRAVFEAIYTPPASGGDTGSTGGTGSGGQSGSSTAQNTGKKPGGSSQSKPETTPAPESPADTVNKGDLEQLINRAQLLNADEQADPEDFAQALENALQVLADPEATQQQVDEAVSQLQKAMDIQLPDSSSSSSSSSAAQQPTQTGGVAAAVAGIGAAAAVIAALAVFLVRRKKN